MHVCPKLNWKPAFGSPQFGSPHYLYATLPDHNCLGDTAGQILLTALEQQDRLLLMPLLPMWGIMRIDAKLPADDDAAVWSTRSGLTRPQLMRSTHCRASGQRWLCALACMTHGVASLSVAPTFVLGA